MGECFKNNYKNYYVSCYRWPSDLEKLLLVEVTKLLLTGDLQSLHSSLFVCFFN